MNITGRLTRDAEVRTTSQDKQVVNFSVVDRTDKVNHSQRMKVSIVKQVLKIDSSEYKFNNYFLIFCA